MISFLIKKILFCKLVKEARVLIKLMQFRLSLNIIQKNYYFYFKVFFLCDITVINMVSAVAVVAQFI
jgi:hypothetical protein